MLLEIYERRSSIKQNFPKKNPKTCMHHVYLVPGYRDTALAIAQHTRNQVSTNYFTNLIQVKNLSHYNSLAMSLSPPPGSFPPGLQA